LGKVISVCNHKGGVAKTTTVMNLGIGLARLGEKVLLVDSDHQGSLTFALGYKDLSNVEVTINELMQKVIDDDEFDAHEAILHHPEGIDLIPADMGFALMDRKLTLAQYDRERIMKAVIDTIRDEYDFILIDCQPSLSNVVINALAASDSVLIPVEPQVLAAKGLTQLLDTIAGVKRHLNKRLQYEGILITKAEPRTNLAKSVISSINSTFGDESIPVFDVVIPKTTRVAETAGLGKSIYLYDSKSEAALAYEKLSKEVLKRGKSK